MKAPLKKTNQPPKREKVDPRAVQQSYLDKIERRAEKEGVVMFDVESGRLNIDDEYLSLPADITDLTPRDLGQYLNAFTQQKVYLRTILCRAEICAEEARRNYSDASETLYRSFAGGKLSETAKDRLINADDQVKPFYLKHIDLKNKIRIVETSIANIEDIIFMLSREVTRRMGDWNDEGRSHNVGRR